MELDDLKTAWAELGRRLDEKEAQLAQLRRRNALSDLQSRLRLVTRGQVAQLLTGLLFALWGGSTWIDHWGTWHLVAYGLGLHAYGVAMLATAAMQLMQIVAVDYAGSVTTIQRSLLQLKRSRVRSERILLAIGGIGWVPALFVLAYYAGWDVWAIRPGHVIANLGVGLAISSGLLWASVRYPAWLERSAQGKHFAEMERDLGDLEQV